MREVEPCRETAEMESEVDEAIDKRSEGDV